jgi:hypothetical protein
MVLAPPNIPGLSSLAPSAEEDAQWGVAPPPPPQPVARMAMPQATASADATAGAYGGGQQMATAQPAAPLAPAYATPQAQPQMTGPANDAAVGTVTGSGSQFPTIRSVGPFGPIASETRIQQPGSLVFTPLEGGPLLPALLGTAGSIGAPKAVEQLGGNQTEQNVASLLGGLGGSVAAGGVSAIRRGIVPEEPSTPAEGGVFARKPYMDDNGILRDGSGRPIGRQYPWSESNPTGYGKSEADASGSPVVTPAPARPSTAHVSEFEKPLPPQPRIPETGQYPAIRTTDGGLYPDLTGGQQSTHLLFADRVGIPRAQVESTGWLVDGDYRVADTDPSWARQARAAARIADLNAAPAPATSPAASSPPTSEAAAGQPAPAGAGPEPPLNDLERQLQQSLKGMTKPQVENLTTADMRAALDEAGLNSSGSPAKVATRYRDMVAAGKGGINTPAENVSNAARDAYSKALAQTGDPGQATLAARRAAAIENASNARASQMQVQQAGLLQTLKDTAARIVKEEDGGSTFGLLEGLGKSAVQLPGDMISLKSSLSPPLLRQGKVSLVTRPVATMREFFQSMKAGFSEQTGRAMQDAIENDRWIRDSKVVRVPDESLQEALPGMPRTRPAPALGEADTDGQTSLGLDAAATPIEPGKVSGYDPYAGYTWKDVGGTILDWGEDATADTRVEERAVGRSSPLGTAIRESLPIKASDRQASVELNLHRTGWYREVASQMWKAGERDVNRYTELRQFIEHATQRGGWSQPSVPLFFSTRAQSGRAQFLWDVATKVPKGVLTGKVLQPGVEQQATRALVGMTAANMAMMGSLAALGLGTVTVNDKGLPTFKRGNFHWDPWAGWNPQAKFILGIGHDIKAELDKHSVDGTWAGVPQDFTQRFGQRAIDFLRKGLSPFYGTVASTYTGEDALGKPFNLAQQARSGQLEADWTLPFVAQDVADGYKDGGPVEAAVAGAGSSLSEGTSVYPPPLGEQRDAKAQELYGKNYGDLTDRTSRQAVDEGINHVQSPFWSSSLNTVKAVDQALTQVGPKYGYAITFGGLQREINQDDNSRKAWNDSKALLDRYQNGLIAQYGDQIARKNYGKVFADLPPAEQTKITTALHTEAQKQNPELDAWLLWWGGSTKLESQAALTALQGIVAKYGNKSLGPAYDKLFEKKATP